MSAVLFTDIIVNQLKATEEQFEVFDKKVKGLALRVSPGGTKTFSILYRFGGRNRRHTFGPYPTVSLKDARQRAQEALRQISNGIDPQTTKLQARSTYTSNLFSNVTADFIENYAKRNTRTWKETERILQNEALSRWSRLPISQISKPMIKSATNEIFKASGPSAANHAFAAFRRLFNWSVEQGHLEHSPCHGMKPPSRTVGRSRVLTDPELAAILLATDKMGFPFGPHVKLAISTAQRRSEVSNLRRTDLDLENRTWTQPANRNKSGRTHIVPLSDLALETIRSMPRVQDELLFPARGKDNPVSGYSKWKRKLDQISGVKNWTLHDLRRSAATGMAQLKVPLHIIELVLNHRSKSLSGVAGIYNQYEYFEEQRDALDRWAKHVEDLLVKAQGGAVEAAGASRNLQAKPVSTASAS